ncbi:NADP-dependent oxidoreductase [Streptomyces phaeochromogenes]|uniref:NADP-dependent oxidoreductase n=1 Tax=Streptomyces phaeochromogenes TaxID=1923 RepID=UPI002DD8D318|nr:NADP-dependent oxidoreductase [Streptomyces phaeochromogenes]WRZ35494.1 NADP-dependent oxidoreductase [Streptomyces phaeochromogenes]WSJ02595.1 NADP-dependent oxidoreductase [Streptomyces phaeochromogenes]
MATVLPATTREILLTDNPVGLPGPEHFTVVEKPLSAPGPGQVLVRNRYFLVFPGLRTLIGGQADGVPLPRIHVGDTLFGPAVGEVVAASAGSSFRPGDAVTHLLGWREHALLAEGDCAPLGDALPDPVAHLSSGSAAYGALTRLAEVRTGDTVFVTGAAGGVGSLAGALARLLGATRVIGSTRSPDKAERLRAELGYDVVLVPGSQSLDAQLAAAAPEGIDVLLDTVGGEQLTAAVRAARRGARFALVGALAGQLSPHGDGGSAPAEIDTFRLVNQSVSLRGYSGMDHPEVNEEWTKRFGQWLRSGEITFPHVRVPGMDRAPSALRELFEGRHFGTVVMELPPR